MKDGFIQALEILEVVKKNIKDKKGNNDDDNYKEKNEKEKNKNKENDKEDDKSVEDIILNDQDDDIEDEKEKKNENEEEEEEELEEDEEEKEEEDNYQITQNQPLLNKIGLNDNNKKYKSHESKNNKIPLKIPIKSNRENKVSPGKNSQENNPLFNKLKLNFDSNNLNKIPNPNKEHFKTIENKTQSKQQVDSKNKKK